MKAQPYTKWPTSSIIILTKSSGQSPKSKDPKTKLSNDREKELKSF